MKRVSVLLFIAATAVPAAQTQTPAGGQTPAGRQTPAAQAPQQQRPAQPPLGENEWRIDSNHSAAHFGVRHMMVSTVRGQLGRISGTIAYDGKDVRSVRADISVDINGINTQNQKRDAHLRTADFFDVANHPNLTFKSKRVESGSNGRFKLIGDLTIRGTTKEAALDVEGPTPPLKERGGVRIGATASTKVNRLEYGLKWNNMIEAVPVVGDEVHITIDLELTRPSSPGTTIP